MPNNNNNKNDETAPSEVHSEEESSDLSESIRNDGTIAESGREDVLQMLLARGIVTQTTSATTTTTTVTDAAGRPMVSPPPPDLEETASGSSNTRPDDGEGEEEEDDDDEEEIKLRILHDLEGTTLNKGDSSRETEDKKDLSESRADAMGESSREDVLSLLLAEGIVTERPSSSATSEVLPPQHETPDLEETPSGNGTTIPDQVREEEEEIKLRILQEMLHNPSKGDSSRETKDKNAESGRDDVLPLLRAKGIVMETMSSVTTPTPSADPDLEEAVSGSSTTKPDIEETVSGSSSARRPDGEGEEDEAPLPPTADDDLVAMDSVPDRRPPPRLTSERSLPGASASGRRLLPRLASERSLPGAFAHFPGGGSVAASDLSLSSRSSSGADSSSAGSRSNGDAESGTTSHHSHDASSEGLARAHPVNEEEERANRQAATPVDLTARTREDPASQLEKRKKYGILGLLMILIAVIVIAVVGGMASTNDSETREQQPVRLNTPTPVTVETGAPTMTPTAPILIEHNLLSSTTIQAIEDPLSPQSKAHEWLASHPSIQTMTQQRKVQLFALAAFFFHFDGDESWVDALQDDFLVYEKSECDWYSDIYATLKYNFVEGKYVLVGRDKNKNLTTCNEMGTLTKFQLQIQQDKPTREMTPMPPEIGLLTALESIRLIFVKFNGPITIALVPEMKQLTNLRSLSFGNNNLTGTIPPSIIALLPPIMQEFTVYGSDLIGTLPTQFQSLTNLKNLRVEGHLSGVIPTELGKLTMLEYLGLRNDRMEGSIPTELYGLTQLSTLDIRPAHLTGTISSHLGDLVNMRILEIGGHLSGTIPDTINDLLQLERLFLDGNDLSGSLPLLVQADNLQRLDLSRNRLDGSIPATMFTNQQWPETLVHLRLDDNFLTGTVPDDIWSLKSLRELRLANNAGLVGYLPADQIVSFSALRILDLQSNAFYGTIPFDAFRNSSGWLGSLNLNGNNFSGSIPSQLGLLTRLSDLNLADNQMIGSIPAAIGNCTWMRFLNLRGNSFVGSVPTQLGLLRYLTELDLSNTVDLIGQMPSELGLLTRLESIALDGTSLSGSVPDEICALRNQSIGSLIDLRINCSAVTCSCNCSCIEQLE